MDNTKLEDKKYRLEFVIYYSWDGGSDNNVYYFDSIDECKDFFKECLKDIKEFDVKYKIYDLHVCGDIYHKYELICKYEYYINNEWKDIEKE